MGSQTNTSIAFVALGILSFAYAAKGGETINLPDFQRVLRTDLDGELVKIAGGSISNHFEIDHRPIHTKRRSNVRRRATKEDIDRHDLLDASQIWNDLLDFAWKTTSAIKRDEHRLSVTSDPDEAHPFPFLICTRGRKNPNTRVQDITKLFGQQPEDSLLLSSSQDETCLILTTTALEAQGAIDADGGNRRLMIMPLLDVSKIHAGTIDEVSSEGWSVPFNDKLEYASSDAPAKKNETEAINEWERIIVVDFVPGLGGMKEEAELLVVVNKMMADIQDMGEVGWLRSLDKEEAEEFVVDESLIGVPSLSDLFSLTSSLRSVDEDNDRIAFWRESLGKGIEAEHVCSEMFTTLFVKPRAGYFSYDLVMNPSDGPPAQNYESSASNPACVMSLIAAISTHPYTLSVKANFPIYHGWHVAQQIDSMKF